MKTFYLNPDEFIIWSGKIRHSSSNNSANSRQSIILQYCSPNNVVKIPENFDYPNTKWSKTKPPCFSISGRDNFNYNKVLSKDSIEPSSELLRKLKTLLLYNGRYKLATLYNKLKKFYKYLLK